MLEKTRDSLGQQGDKNQPTLKEIRVDSLKGEAPILWPDDEKSQLIGKDSDGGKDGGQEEKGMAEEEVVR